MTKIVLLVHDGVLDCKLVLSGKLWLAGSVRAAAGGSATIESNASQKKNRGVVIMPGLGNSKIDYKALAELLTNEGLVVEIAGVNRIDWLRNAAGVVDINYWKGTLNPQPTVNW